MRTNWNNSFDISNARDISDALSIANLDWEVEGKPIYDENHKEITGFKANTRVDTNEVFAIVSSKYHIVQNSDAFEFIDNLVNEYGMKFEEAGVYKDGASSWISGSFGTVDINGVTVENRIAIQNSHDGSVGLKVSIIPYINNGSILNPNISARRSIILKHVGAIKNKVLNAKESFGLSNRYLSALKDTSNELINKKLTERQIRLILASLVKFDFTSTNERKVRSYEHFCNTFFSFYHKLDKKPYYGTAWGVLIASSEMICQGEARRKTKNSSENKFHAVINGYSLLDQMYKELIK